MFDDICEKDDLEEILDIIGEPDSLEEDEDDDEGEPVYHGTLQSAKDFFKNKKGN